MDLIKTKQIQPTDFIGDSLTDINNNFYLINNKIDTLNAQVVSIYSQLTVLLMCIKDVADTFNTTYPESTACVRMSLNKNVSLRNNITSKTLYIHPYKGNSIGLYNIDLKKWVMHTIDSVIECDLSELEPDSNYDVYIWKQDDLIYVYFDKWLVVNTPPLKKTINGALVHLNVNIMRYIGCVHIMSDGNCEQSYNNYDVEGAVLNQFVWNHYNREKTLLIGAEGTINYHISKPLDKSNNAYKQNSNGDSFWNFANALNSPLYSNITYIAGSTSFVEVTYNNTINCNGNVAMIGIGDDISEGPSTHSSIAYHYSESVIHAQSEYKKNNNGGLRTIQMYSAAGPDAVFCYNSAGVFTAYITN